MEVSEAVQAQQVAAEQQRAAAEFFGDIEALCAQAADFLAELAKQADEADRQKLRTAALKARLSQLTKDRRSREAAAAAALEAKQRELERLLAEERALQPEQQPLPPPIDYAQPSPIITSPVSRTG